MARINDERTKKLLKKIGAVETINSGATFSDNDGNIRIKVGNYRGISVEVKTTDKKSFTVNSELWKKTRNSANSYLKMPVLLISTANENLVVLDMSDFLIFLEELEKKHDTNALHVG